MTDTIYALKATGPGRRSPQTGHQWTRAWMPPTPPILCRSGYHACTDTLQLLNWLDAEIHVVRLRGDIIHGDDKVAASEARWVRQVDAWNDRTARLFAADCAAAVLPLFERDHPGDDRPRRAIEVARLYAEGKATDDELAAAGDAAWDAAGAAAGAAAWDADGAAAWDAARAAAWGAARRKQAARLADVLDLPKFAPEAT